MARILITSGPTRQYIDPVRYLTNASSGRMGAALADACVAAGHEVVVVSGPVLVTYPEVAQVVEVMSTEQMLEICQHKLPDCDGLIAAAAPCDYRPIQVAGQKISKTGEPWLLKLVETPDIVAAMATQKRPDQWFVGFALETNDQHIRAQVKLEKKSCDLMILNGPQAIDSDSSGVEVMDRQGAIIGSFDGSKREVAAAIIEIIRKRLIQ